MKIKYIGDEFTEVFGFAFKPGETVDVTDAYAAEKLRFNPRFEAVEAKDRPKDGDKPKPMKPAEGLDAARDAITAKVNKAILAEIERKKKEG